VPRSSGSKTSVSGTGATKKLRSTMTGARNSTTCRVELRIRLIAKVAAVLPGGGNAREVLDGIAGDGDEIRPARRAQ